MDPTQTTGGVQPSGDSGAAVEVSPIAEGWAPGVSRVPVSGGSRRLRWGIAGAIVIGSKQRSRLIQPMVGKPMTRPELEAVVSE